MWSIRLNLLQHLNLLTSNKETFKYTGVGQKAFDDIKHIVAHDNLLAYTDLNEWFDIHMDASYYQTGVVISQSEKPITFYSRILTGPQTRYEVVEKELLCIIEALK